MNKTKNSHNLEQGAFLLFLSAIAAKIISAFFKIPLSSEYCLGDLGFGYFASVHDLITPIHTLAVSGLPVAVSHLVAECVAKDSKNDLSRVFFTSRRIILVLAIVCAAVILLMSYPFVALTDKTGQSFYSVLALIPAVFFCLLTSVYRGYFEGIKNMTPAAVSDVVESFTKMILGFTLAFVTVKITGNLALGAASAVFGLALGAFASLCYLMYRFKRADSILSFAVKDDRVYDKTVAKTVLAMAFPVAVASISGSMISLIDTLTVRTQLANTLANYPDIINSMYSSAIASFNETAGQGLTTEEIPTFLYGIRSKAYTLYNLIPTLTVALGVGAVPEITHAFSKEDKAGVNRGVASVLRLTALVSMPAGLGLFSLSGGVFRLLYGQSGSSVIGGRMLAIYSIAGILAGISVVLSCVLQAINRYNTVLLNVLAGIGIKVVLNLILSAIPELNIFGSIYSTLICFTVILLLNLISLLRYSRIERKVWVSLFKIFISAVLCGISAFLISSFGDSKLLSLLAILVAMLVYFFLILLTKAFSKADVERFPAGKILSKFVK